MNSVNIQNQCHIIAEVTGSSPVSPTTASVYINEELSLRDILETLLGPEGKRRFVHINTMLNYSVILFVTFRDGVGQVVANY